MEIKAQTGDDAKLSGGDARGGEGCYFYEGIKGSYRCVFYSTSTQMTENVDASVFWRARLWAVADKDRGQANKKADNK
eukprot:288513-Alexandrium_andersonii.AAC.1